MPGGAEPNPELATRIAKKLISGIAEQNAAIDLNALETDLEIQDHTSALFYGDDDLGHEAVVAAASKQS
ncbi:hypothetical protein GSI_11366 [Ganoderma sinense ZZ0214-1]|uniref:Uncharacterized protein n=1 Tax=Ganoderma sinense ZZ0214-1 TaxID=1077348 RepID=A0A2G8RVT8_9APHY|nr:hypothetical protein GSI_11366 [Ganoderma sinense ZZ0214-1]